MAEDYRNDPVQVWALVDNSFSSVYLYCHSMHLARNLSNREKYIFGNSEAMRAQAGTLFESTAENWPHLLQKYAAEAEMVAKAGKKAVLPPDAPAFIRQVTDGSVVSEDVAIEEGVMIKKSLVCPHCKIGKGSKVVNCVVHKGAIIGEQYATKPSNRCTLTSCVVGAKAKVADGVTVKDEVVGCRQEFNEGSLEESSSA